LWKKEENAEGKFIYGLLTLSDPPHVDERCPVETGFIVEVKRNCR